MTKMNNNKSISKVLFFLIVFISFNVNATSRPAESETNIRYTINIFDSNLGEVYTKITQQGKEFNINSVTKAEGAASLLMGGDLLQNCKFSTADKKITLNSSVTEKIGSKPFKSSVKLDHSNKKISFKGKEGNKVIDIPSGYMVDSCNLQFAAAYTAKETLKNQTIYVVGGKKNRIKGYIFKSESQEILKTPIGKLKSTKIVLEREFNPEKKFIFWVSEKYPHFPLKMMDQRRSGSRIMTIKSVN